MPIHSARALVRFYLVSLAILLLVTPACRSKSQETIKSEAIQQGDELMRQKKPGAAAAAYRTAVDAAPDDGNVRLKLGRALQESRQLDQAARQFITAAEQLPDNWEAQTEALTWMLRQARYFDAVERATALQKKKPEDPQLLMLLGLAVAQFRYPEWGIFEVENEMRLGRHFEGARIRLSPTPGSKPPAEAERRLSEAYTLAPDQFGTRLALAGFLWIYGDQQEGTNLLKIAADKAPDNLRASRALGLYYDYKNQVDDAERYLKISASRGDRDSKLALADFYYRRKKYAEALAVLTPMVGDDADGAVASRAADVDMALGRPADALARAETALAKNANNPVGLRVKAAALLASGDKVRALEVAREAVAAATTSSAARVVLGQALEANGALSSAFDEYSQAWQSDTRDPAMAKTLARVAFALGRFGIAVDLANQSLRLKPGDTDAAVLLARSHIRLGEFAVADRALESFIAGKTSSAEILALQGQVLAARGNAAGARTAFANALQIDRDAIDALSGLLDLEVKAGQAAKIRPQIEQALARHPKDPAYLLLSAEIAAAEKNFPRAEQALRAVLDGDGANEDAALMLTSVLAEQSRLKDAQAVAEKSLERLPTSSRVRMKLAEILELQGLALESQTQYEKVISDNQLAGATTDMIDAFNTASARLAALFANQGIKLDQALQLASAATRYRPGDPVFSDTLGWVHVRKDRASIGLPYLQAAVDKDPANPVFRYHLGVAYEQLGEYAKAKSELTRAVQGNAKFKGADDARALLKAIGR